MKNNIKYIILFILATPILSISVSPYFVINTELTWILNSVVLSITATISAVMLILTFDKLDDGLTSEASSINKNTEFKISLTLLSLENQIREFKKGIVELFQMLTILSTIFILSYVLWYAIYEHPLEVYIIISAFIFSTLSTALLLVSLSIINHSTGIKIEDDKIILDYRMNKEKIKYDNINHIEAKRYNLIIKCKDGQKYRIWTKSPNKMEKKVLLKRI